MMSLGYARSSNPIRRCLLMFALIGVGWLSSVLIAPRIAQAQAEGAGQAEAPAAAPAAEADPEPKRESMLM